GLRPPVVSTHAEKGIRSNEPDSAGAATKKPTIMGLSSMTSWNRFAVGPNRATAAKPIKKPSVAAKSPSRGDPLIFMLSAFLTVAYEVRRAHRTTCGLRHK